MTEKENWVHSTITQWLHVKSLWFLKYPCKLNGLKGTIWLREKEKLQCLRLGTRRHCATLVDYLFFSRTFFPCHKPESVPTVQLLNLLGFHIIAPNKNNWLNKPPFLEMFPMPCGCRVYLSDNPEKRNDIEDKNRRAQPLSHPPLTAIGSALSKSEQAVGVCVGSPKEAM